MVGWIVRMIMFMASIVTGWFVARDAANFSVIQMAVSLLLITFFVVVAAFWPSLAAFFKSKHAVARPPDAGAGDSDPRPSRLNHSRRG